LFIYFILKKEGKYMTLSQIPTKGIKVKGKFQKPQQNPDPIISFHLIFLKPLTASLSLSLSLSVKQKQFTHSSSHKFQIFFSCPLSLSLSALLLLSKIIYLPPKWLGVYTMFGRDAM
jgi:hypothetical protein